jgi:hypothetical protein
VLRKIAIASVAVAGATGILFAATGAGADTNTEAFRIVETNGSATVTAHGVFDASGVDIVRSQTDRLVFPDGSLIINHPDADGTFTFKLNPATCTARIKLSGAYTISNGKRAYKGATGSGTYQGKGTTVLARKSDGSCDFNAEPISDNTVIHASGPISFAG